MKNLKLAFIILLIAAFFNACRGDHPVNHGKDTAKNPYNAPPVMEKPDTTTGDATTDNSGSGGTKIVKDTSKTKRDSSKKK